MSEHMNNMRENVNQSLLNIYKKLDISTPENHENIVDYIHRRVFENSFPEYYDEQDVLLAFREWIERRDLVKLRRRWLREIR